MLFTSLGRSLLGRTVSEVLSTTQGRRQRTALKTEGKIFPQYVPLGWRITYLFTLADCVFTFVDIRPPCMVKPVAFEKLFSSAVLKNIIYNKWSIWFSLKF